MELGPAHPRPSFSPAPDGEHCENVSVEGTPAGVSVYQVSFPFVARDPALCHLLTSYPPASQGAVGAVCAQVTMGTWHG